MAAKWKEPPRDALDTLTLTAVDMPSMDLVISFYSVSLILNIALALSLPLPLPSPFLCLLLFALGYLP